VKLVIAGSKGFVCCPERQGVPMDQCNRGKTTPRKRHHRVTHIVFQAATERGKIFANVKNLQISGRLRKKKGILTRTPVMLPHAGDEFDCGRRASQRFSNYGAIY